MSTAGERAAGNKFGSRTVSDNPPRHSGVGFRRDF